MTLRSVCVFCGASPGASPVYQEAAVALGRHLAERGLTLVYGGGAVGLMGTVADAALAAGGEVIGIIPQSLQEAEIGHKGLTRLEVVDGMHARKARMAELADAFIALPGGLGTLEEPVRGLDLGPTGLPRQAAGPARSERFLRPAADFPRPPGRRTLRPRRTPRHAAARCQPGGAARFPRRLDAKRGAEVGRPHPAVIRSSLRTAAAGSAGRAAGRSGGSRSTAAPGRHPRNRPRRSSGPCRPSAPPSPASGCCARRCWCTRYRAG